LVATAEEFSIEGESTFSSQTLLWLFRPSDTGLNLFRALVALFLPHTDLFDILAPAPLLNVGNAFRALPSNLLWVLLA